jgi:1,6-anhydro-N-acetylmuramate kinase
MDLYLGLISGTSMDAIDAALVDFGASPLSLVAASATPLDPELKARITAVIESPEHASLDEIGQIDVAAAREFSNSTLDLLRRAGVEPSEVTAIGSHGQTLRHRPDLSLPFTWQIGDPNVLAELTGITVVADFRRRDVAAGGQGAPLLPVFHDQVFRSDAEDRVILNLGGIANITILARGKAVSGFDTGPANRLLDAWISSHRGAAFDEHGAWSSTGHCDAGLLNRLLAEPYLALPPPKSTGRELFNMPWLLDRLGREQRCSNTPPPLSPMPCAGTPLAPRSMPAAGERIIRRCSPPSPAGCPRRASRPPRLSASIRTTSRRSPSPGLRGARSRACPRARRASPAPVAHAFWAACFRGSMTVMFDASHLPA